MIGWAKDQRGTEESMERKNEKSSYNWGLALLKALLCFVVVVHHYWRTDANAGGGYIPRSGRCMKSCAIWRYRVLC